EGEGEAATTRRGPLPLGEGGPERATRVEGPGEGAAPRIDLEGLQVAYLDDSGRIDYYLDTYSGDVVEVHDGIRMEPPRFLRVPRRSEASDAEDRRAFVATLDASALRDRLANADAA